MGTRMKKENIKNVTEVWDELFKAYKEVIKTYGPFTVEIPKHMTKDDVYKLAMYVLL